MIVEWLLVGSLGPCAVHEEVRFCTLSSVCDHLFYRMLIPKQNRKKIYEHLFKEGVLVAKKNFNAPKHMELDTVPNLQVIKAMQVTLLDMHVRRRCDVT